MKVWLGGQLSCGRMSETKTKVDLKYELDEYDDGTKKSVVVDCKNHRQNIYRSKSRTFQFYVVCRVHDEKELEDIIDKIPESIRFKFRKEVVAQ